MAGLEIVKDATHVKALGMGMNLGDLGQKLPELEAACNRKIEAQEDFKNIIEQKNRSNAGESVAACGLYLVKIGYPEDIKL